MAHKPTTVRHKSASGRAVGMTPSVNEPMPLAAGSQPQHDYNKEHVAINDDRQLNISGGNSSKLGLQRVKTWRPLDKVGVSSRRYRDPAALISQTRSKTPVPYSEPSTALASRITRQQFEALPPAIQRKHFSPFERLRLATTKDDNQDFPLFPLPPRSASAPPGSDEEFPGLRQLGHKQSSSIDSQTRHCPRLTSLDQRFLIGLPDKVKRSLLNDEERFLAHQPPHAPAPGTLKKQSSLPDCSGQEITKMAPRQDSLRPATAQPRPSRESGRYVDSLAWLEQNDGLDLTLYIGGQDDEPAAEPKPSSSRRPSFRRHLSMNKLPFKRSSISQSRPDTRDTMVAPSFRSQGTSIGSLGHSRRKSLGLSFMLNKQTGPVEPAAVVDPEAAHYQDPEARMKLRAYLASPQKFDEALEFGFPSKDEEERNYRGPKHDDEDVDPMDQLRSFLDDDKSSTYSSNSTMDDLESPKTPPMLDKPLPLLPAGGKFGDAFMIKPQDDHNGTHREMTLRMTLTRPDLRANEDDIYRWQQSVEVRKAHMRGEILAPVSLNKTLDQKSRIDKQFAAMDQENFNQAEGGMVKRLWKRVRRA